MIRAGVFVLISFLFFLFQGCTDDIDRGNELEAYLPDNAETILKIGNIESIRAAIGQNELLSKNEQIELFRPFSANNSLSDILQPIQTSYLALYDSDSEVSEFTWIVNKDSTFTKLDSIIANQASLSTVTKDSIFEMPLNDEQLFVHKADSIYLISELRLSFRSSTPEAFKPPSDICSSTADSLARFMEELSDNAILGLLRYIISSLLSAIASFRLKKLFGSGSCESMSVM